MKWNSAVKSPLNMGAIAQQQRSLGNMEYSIVFTAVITVCTDGAVLGVQ
jgi:hypothetical protein